MMFHEIRARYENDPEFHAIVDQLYYLLHQGRVTVNELRDACTCAGWKFEVTDIRPMVMRAPLHSAKDIEEYFKDGRGKKLT